MGKAKISDTEQRQFWQMVLEKFQSSGLSVRQFCRQEGLSEPSFYSWRRRLTQARNSDGISKPETQSEAFIRVSIPPSQPGCLELILAAGHTLRIPLDIDGAFLTGVLSALTQAKLC